MTKRVLILGAGLVSQPIIDYLFEKTDYFLTVADILEANAGKAIKDNPRGQAKVLDVNNSSALRELVVDSDLVVSLLPYTLHGVVASHCLEAEKHMVNASYVTEELRAFDSAARDKNLLFLCEMGLDPGIDHMSAMQIIHDIQRRGGRISEFISVCGGLPAPDANDNPFGYKFSWSPKGVLLAGNNSARFIDEGKVKTISSDELFHSTTAMQIGDLEFEAYPNRDSIAYEHIYGLDGIQHLMRGTLRYAGWHNLMLALKTLNLIKDTSVTSGKTSYAEMLADLNNFDLDILRSDVARKLGMSEDAAVINALDWLGLFDATPRQFQKTNAIGVLAELMNQKMGYGPGERDMVALQHRFKASFPDHKEEIRSTLIDYGIPNGTSSMARTVSSPLAISVRLILESTIKLTGIQIPVDPIIYEPVLAELKTMGISFTEEVLRT
ncbi:MAG: saccharopine dehydrogenase NADP-binding domain-containing protein [Candidatus Marinimicrobia bacterium]|nr:saccharopine dehydrogenase NADP-binding domain-containing protein [Candidatus Neomarinimicrobiota bacterium]